MKNQHDAKNYLQNNEIDLEKIQLRGRSKKNGLKRSAVRKTSGKATQTPASSLDKTSKNLTARKTVSRFIQGETLFRDTLSEMPFGHDDYQLDAGRFVDEDINSSFAVDARRSFSLDLDEREAPGIYSDQQLVLEIRRAVERDSAVSSAVQKIQMTAKNGVVILKGTVASEQEQMIIEDKAVALAGFGQVVNQLEVIEDMIE